MQFAAEQHCGARAVMKAEYSSTRAKSLASFSPVSGPAEISDLAGIAGPRLSFRNDIAVVHAVNLDFGGPLILTGAGPAPVVP